MPRRALAYSQNLPTVILLRRIFLQRMFGEFRALGMTNLDGSAERFGPSLATGSMLTSQDRLMRAYATLAGRINDDWWTWLRESGLIADSSGVQQNDANCWENVGQYRRSH